MNTVPSLADGSAPVMISSERTGSLCWIGPHSDMCSPWLVPPRAFIPPKMVLVWSFALPRIFTANSESFAFTTSNISRSSSGMESNAALTLWRSLRVASPCVWSTMLPW